MAASVSYQVRIRVRGTLDPAWWSARFAGLSIEPDRDRTTRLSGVLPDQAALHGLLAAVRDLGLSIVSVDAADVVAQQPDPTWIPRGDRR